MLIEQVDMVGPQSLQRSLDHLADMLGPAIEPDGLAFSSILKPNFVQTRTWSRTGSRASPTSSSLMKRTVALRGVEEGDSTIDGRADYGDRLLLVGGGAKAEAQAHAAEPMAETSRLLFPSLRFFILRSCL